jgi:predicted  nucleic acid-binding Zn-ribbon protein
MRFLPFKALLLLVVFPPCMYLAVLQGGASVLTGRYQKALDRFIPGDPQPLLSGRVALEDVIQDSIRRLYREDPLLSRGVQLTVTVKTSAGRRIYPPVFEAPGNRWRDRSLLETASRNYALLNEGLVIAADVRIGQNTRVANLVLAGCLTVALAGLVVLYRRGARRLKKEEAEHGEAIRQWRARDESQRGRLEALKSDHADLLNRISKMESKLEHERRTANRNEEELFDEVAQLERQLQAHREQHQLQADQIGALEKQLAALSRDRDQQSTTANRTMDAWRKRFGSLYKETIVSDRAVKGFSKLSDALQIKAEEVIHRLDAKPEVVTIKRKLFQRKGRETVFEVVFGRKGRLYFRRNKNRQVEVLAIGTKNDQWRDLGFLDRIGAEAGRRP